MGNFRALWLALGMLGIPVGAEPKKEESSETREFLETGYRMAREHDQDAALLAAGAGLIFLTRTSVKALGVPGLRELKAALGELQTQGKIYADALVHARRGADLHAERARFSLALERFQRATSTVERGVEIYSPRMQALNRALNRRTDGVAPRSYATRAAGDAFTHDAGARGQLSAELCARGFDGLGFFARLRTGFGFWREQARLTSLLPKHLLRLGGLGGIYFLMKDDEAGSQPSDALSLLELPPEGATTVKETAVSSEAEAEVFLKALRAQGEDETDEDFFNEMRRIRESQEAPVGREKP